MRKLSLLLLAMLMVSSMVFAQVQVEYDLEAEATATFGVNLDHASDGTETVKGPTTGFRLDHEIDFSVTFVEETTTEFGEGDVYGWIEIEDFEFVAESAATEDTPENVVIYNGEISSKVFLGPAYIVIATAATDINMVEYGLNVDETILNMSATAGDRFEGNDVGTAVAVGFTVPDLFNIELSLASVGEGTANDWSDNLYNNYYGAIYTETTLDGLTIALELASSLRSHTVKDRDDDGIVESTESEGDFGDGAFIGLGVEYEMMLNDMMTLVPYVGVDLYNDPAAGKENSSTSTRAGALDWEAKIGANVLWGADDLEVFEGTEDTHGGVGVEFGLGRDNKTGEDTFDDFMWVRAGLAEDSGDDGLLPVVGGAALVEWIRLTQTVADDEADPVDSLSFGLELDADLGVVSPFFGWMYANYNLDKDTHDDQEGLTMKIGTDINVIPATTFTVAYESGNLLLSGDGLHDGETYNYEAARNNVDGKTGVITIATKVSY